MRTEFFQFILIIFFTYSTSAQTYQSWRLGSNNSIDTDHQFGIMLAGGGRDHDGAMKWMLNKAAGGDIVIIRTSGSNGYNSYFFSELGVSVNSVETLLINSRAAANDPYVAQRIREAEVLFIAGGDQTTYYDNWRNTATHQAIQYLISEKKSCVGGTSAGMAILGECFYIPQNSGVTWQEALYNPFHPNMQTIGYGDFLDIPLLKNTITDTHFDERNRAGRLVTFMARMENNLGINSKAIACNEKNAVGIEEDGGTLVFSPSGQGDYVYFVKSTCDLPQSKPEVCLPNTPLTWDKDQKALLVIRIKGNEEGYTGFNFLNFEATEAHDAAYMHWYVINGLQRTQPAFSVDCEISTHVKEEKKTDRTFETMPNPIENELILKWNPLMTGQKDIIAYNSLGQIVSRHQVTDDVDSCIIPTHSWPKGTYQVCLSRMNSDLHCTQIIK